MHTNSIFGVTEGDFVSDELLDQCQEYTDLDEETQRKLSECAIGEDHGVHTKCVTLAFGCTVVCT